MSDKKIVWIAETGDHRYMEVPQVGRPVGLTSDLAEANQFKTRFECLSFCTGTYARASLPELHPVKYTLDRPTMEQRSGRRRVMTKTDDEHEVDDFMSVHFSAKGLRRASVITEMFEVLARKLIEILPAENHLVVLQKLAAAKDASILLSRGPGPSADQD